ncbi:MAG: hypothetical protein ACRDHZ_03125 [Ktedonobacteraceae bacterium]
MITGYFIRQHKGLWCVIEQDEQYRERIVENGLTFKAACDHWRELIRDFMRKPRHERVPGAGSTGEIIGRSTPDSPRQLALKF